MSAHGQAIKLLSEMKKDDFKKMAFTYAEKHPVSFLKANGIIREIDKITVPGFGRIPKDDFVKYRKIVEKADHPITAIRELHNLTDYGLINSKEFYEYVRCKKCVS
jgi:hypothetical protein